MICVEGDMAVDLSHLSDEKWALIQNVMSDVCCRGNGGEPQPSEWRGANVYSERDELCVL